nr:hypothetical protein [Tanacetum cinerariifolium]
MSRSNIAGGKNQLTKACLISSQVDITPGLSSSNQILASPARDDGKSFSLMASTLSEMKNVGTKSRAARPLIGRHTFCRVTDSPAGRLRGHYGGIFLLEFSFNALALAFLGCGPSYFTISSLQLILMSWKLERCSVMDLRTPVMFAGFQANTSRLLLSRSKSFIRPFSNRLPPMVMEEFSCSFRYYHAYCWYHGVAVKCYYPFSNQELEHSVRSRWDCLNFSESWWMHSSMLWPLSSWNSQNSFLLRFFAEPYICGGALNFIVSIAKISFRVLMSGVNLSCLLLNFCQFFKFGLLLKLGL